MKKNNDFNKVWVSGAVKSTDLVNVSKPANILLWFASIAILAFGVSSTVYIGESSAYSTSLALVVVLVALVVARYTNQGRRFWAFFNASKLELAKVVWPTRKETMTITVMVIAVVIVFSIFISLFGLIFENFIKYFLG